MIAIGARCRVINAAVKKNEGAEVIVIGDAGVRHFNNIGSSQCYFLDRELETLNGSRRNWTSEKQLEPLDDLATKEKQVDRVITAQD